MDSLQVRQNTPSTVPQHTPYAPTTASLGGVPSVKVDVPITSVFLLLFLLGAIAHMTIFQLNRRKGHKFLMSAMTFGFCFSRCVTMTLRIAWATRPKNVSLAIAAQIFVAAGVVLLFIINVIFAQRIVRAAHPHSGWHPIFNAFFAAIYVVIVLSLIMTITATIQSFYTLNANTRRIDHDIQLYSQTYYVFIGFLPFLLVVGGLVVPRETRVEKFGSGRFRTKVAILVFSSLLICLGASFRAGINYKPARPSDDPAGYQSKACFYIFDFTVEIIVVWLYFILRVDNRFFVPDGSRKAGDYSRRDGEGLEKEGVAATRIMSEEEVFDDAPDEPSMKEQGRKDEERA